jgi:signal transduction histidine kinase
MARPSGRTATFHHYPENVQGVWGWLRSHPREADLALAAALLVVSVGQWTGDPVIGLVSAALAATVVLRRKYPAQAFTAAVVIATAQVTFGLGSAGAYAFGVQAPGNGSVGYLQPTVTDLALVVLLYTLAAYKPRKISIPGLVICVILSEAGILRWQPQASSHPGGLLFFAAFGLAGVELAAWVLGDSVAYRYRVAYYASLEDRAARLEAERDAQARIAAAAERARELQERRAMAVDESAARLRRIERDLHDGAQVRLAALAMTIGEIKENLDGAGDIDRTRMLVGAAHDNAKETLAELRNLARGIHPAVLDRGLRAALSALTQTIQLPVTLEVHIATRPSPAIEAIAYFCTAELLANIAKHSGASHVSIDVMGQDGQLLLKVADDGRGEARLVPGGGLAGLRERVQTVDGHIGIVSPAGGPTVVTIGLPGHA